MTTRPWRRSRHSTVAITTAAGSRSMRRVREPREAEAEAEAATAGEAVAEDIGAVAADTATIIDLCPAQTGPSLHHDSPTHRRLERVLGARDTPARRARHRRTGPSGTA